MAVEPVEILAPAGSYESLSAALNAGCDAVYFGVGELNMRARSRNNFTISDLPNIVAQCKARNVKTSLTLNTVLFDADLALMRTVVDRAVDAGVSAVIVSDPAVMQYAARVGMRVHMSTQSNITNIEAVRFYAQWADVMVLARELTLDQVSEIARVIREEKITGPSGNWIRLEIFIHGALCMAVSGKCYLSLHAQNSSANRGSCAQNCRRPYIVTDKKTNNELEVDNEYIMSASDLCTIPFFDQVLDAGVEILKIEGRGRSADYVHSTVSCYREAVEAVRTGTFTPEKIAVWEEQLASVYNRGFWDGYYLGRKTGEWCNVFGSQATERKIYLGHCKNYYRKASAGVFYVEAGAQGAGRLKYGDEILITGPTTGVMRLKINELRIDDESVAEVQKGDLFTTPVPEKVRPSDKLFKIVPA